MNDSGPALPGKIVEGMSLRDWFAGMALAGMWATGNKIMKNGRSESSDLKFAELSELAYEQADAMLKSKEKSDET